MRVIECTCNAISEAVNVDFTVNVYECDPTDAAWGSYSDENACNGVKMREFQALVGFD